MIGTFGNYPKLDDRDREFIKKELEKFDSRDNDPRSGDYVIFADGVTRRVSHVYPRDWEEMAGVQTSDNGSWYFGYGDCSFSGSLFPMVKMDTLTLTDDKRTGQVWTFHHDYATAHNGVYFEIAFRIYRCSENASR